MNELTPIIVGVGQINDRPPIPTDGLDPIIWASCSKSHFAIWGTRAHLWPRG